GDRGGEGVAPAVHADGDDAELADQEWWGLVVEDVHVAAAAAGVGDGRLPAGSAGDVHELPASVATVEMDPRKGDPRPPLPLNPRGDAHRLRVARAAAAAANRDPVDAQSRGIEAGEGVRGGRV